MNSDQCTIHLISANLGRLLGPRLPEAVVEAARAQLQKPEVARRLRGAWITSFGDDLHLHLTTCHRDFTSAEEAGTVTFAAARQAALAALTRGLDLGLRGPVIADHVA